MLNQKLFKNRTGQDFLYLQYTPQTNDNNPKPLVVYLHGAGERNDITNNDMSIMKTMGLLNQINNEKTFPFYLVAPQCPLNKHWGCFIESLNSFLDYIIENNNIDTKRIYLTGYSMGGTGTWTWSISNPERFAAIIPVCGTGIYWYGEQLINMPTWVFHGDCDDIVPAYESLNMVNSINKRGGKAKITILQNVAHNAWDYSYSDEVLNWLLSCKKREE